MIRLREIDDEVLRERVRAKIAEQRDMPAAAVPDWFELDDADLSEILIEMGHANDETNDEQSLDGDGQA